MELVSGDVEVAGFDETWAMVTVGAPPVQALFDRVGEAGRERLRDSLAQVVHERFGAGPIRITNVATLGSGVAL